MKTILIALLLFSTPGFARTSMLLMTYANLKLTPGATYSSNVDEICQPGYTTKVRKQLTQATKQKVIALYGISKADRHNYVLDHLIPLEVGGAPNAVTNLWPQPVAEAKLKDKEENEYHHKLCSHQVGIIDAWNHFPGAWAK